MSANRPSANPADREISISRSRLWWQRIECLLTLHPLPALQVKAVVAADRAVVFKCQRDSENQAILAPMLQAIASHDQLPFELCAVEVCNKPSQVIGLCLSFLFPTPLAPPRLPLVTSPPPPPPVTPPHSGTAACNGCVF